MLPISSPSPSFSSPSYSPSYFPLSPVEKDRTVIHAGLLVIQKQDTKGTQCGWIIKALVTPIFRSHQRSRDAQEKQGGGGGVSSSQATTFGYPLRQLSAFVSQALIMGSTSGNSPRPCATMAGRLSSRDNASVSTPCPRSTEGAGGFPRAPGQK